MSKKFLFGFAAFVCAALIFTGCPQEADPDPDPEPTAAEKAAAELGAALGSDKATVSGTTVTLIADYTVTGGATLAVPAGVTLAVPVGKTLDVASGGIINVAENANVVVNGKLTTTSGATGTNNGTITVESGGTSVSTDDNAVGGQGKIVVESGGKAYWGGESGTLIAGASSDAAAVFKLGTSATFSFNNTSFGIAGGEVTVATNFTINSKLQVLTIEASGTLILPKITTGNKVSLTLYDEDGTGGAPLVGKPGATVEIKNEAYVEFADETNADDGEKNVCTANNFYASSGVKITLTSPGSWNGNVPRDYKPSADETYKWTADADGSGTAGWLKEADSV